GSSGTSGFGSSTALTVTVAVSVLLPSCVVTVIVASPSATPVTVPLLDTVAIASSELLYDTDLFVAVDGATVLFNLVVASTSTLAVLGVIVTPVTAIGFAVTVNAHLAVLLPSLVVTVMSAAPGLTAVTLPVLSTVAIAAS